MGNGYLGKISAIVTANTSELSRNLNAGAKDVRAFAQGVSRDIGRLSGDAQRQFSQIFTPLQRFERALQAAASQKLSFKGFDGAIRTVEQLRSRLASLKDQSIINLAVKASGLGSIDQLRESIRDVASREVRIIAEVGGIEKVRELRQQIAESDGKSIRLKVGAVGIEQLDAALERFQGFSNRQIEIIANVGGLDRIREIQSGINSVDGKTVVVNVGEVNAEELDAIAVKLSGLDNRTLKTVIDVVGQASLDKAIQTQRQLVSASEQIAKPLAAARAEFDRLPISLQGGFINALNVAQGDVEKLKADIDAGVVISEARFASLEKVVLRTAAAISRVGEAAKLASQGATGDELVFRAPRVAQELQANAASRQAAAAAPAAALDRDTGIARTVGGLREVAKEISRIQAQVESGRELRVDTREAEANLDKLLARSERLRARLQDQVQVAVIGPNLGARTEIGDRQAVARARQEEAAFAERAAEQTERDVRAANRLLLQQVAIRDAVRERSRNFAQDFAPAPSTSVNLFDTRESDRQSVLREAETLADQINRLPDQTRAALSSTTDRFNGIYNSVRTATGGVGVLRDAISGLRAELGRETAIAGQANRSFALASPPREQRSLGLFGSQSGTEVERAIARARQASAAFASLPESAQAGLRGLAGIASNVANGVETGTSNASQLNAVLDRLVSRIGEAASETARLQSIEEARTASLQRQSQENDRLINQERQLYEERVRAAQATAASRGSSLSGAASALLGPRRTNEADIDSVFAGLERQAVDFRAAADAAFGSPEYQNLADAVRRAGSEIESIQSEIQRLTALDPQRDIAEYAAEWARVDNRVRQVNDLMRQGVRISEQATAELRARAEAEALARRQRTEVASTMLPPVLQEESQLLSMQGASTDVSQRLRDQQEARRRAVEAEIARQERELGPNLGASSPVFLRNGRGDPAGPRGPDLPPGFGGDSRAGLGAPIDDANRRLDVLRGSLVGIKGQIDSLPAGIRAQFIPAIAEAEQRFLRLASGGVSATAEEIEDAAAEVDRLRQRLGAAAQAASLPTFAQFAADLDTRAAIGRVQGLQQVLARIGAEAGGPVAQAFDIYTRAVNEAVAAGTTGFPAVRAQLQGMENDAIDAVVATGRISRGQAQGMVARSGDVARGSFGNAGLAIQQAAFAFEDFFSVTGDISQRIRAAGNNLSQLGFILGSTEGLIAGIVVGVGAQFAAMLITWAQNGRTAQDETKSLNDALARQKSLVEELRQAFESLGDSIARRAFSSGAQEAREFAKQIEEIARKQKELRDARAADLDPTVQRERATQGALGRRLESETNIGRRIAIQQEIRQSQERERAAAEAAASRPAASDAEAARSIEAAGRVLFERRTRGEIGPSGEYTEPLPTEADLAVREEARRRAEAAAGASPVERRNLLRQQMDALTGSGFASDPRVAEQIRQLEVLIASLETPVQRALDELTNEILRSSAAAASNIEAAQSDVADAIRRGVPGAGVFQANLDNLATQLDQAQSELRDAQADVTSSPEDRARRIEAAQTRVRDLNNARDAINEQAREIRLRRTFGGERSTQALSQLQGNERFANEYGRLTARLTTAVDGELQARRELEQAIRGGNQEEIAAAQASLELANKASDAAAAAAELAIALERAVGRIRAIAESASSESVNIADNAQRRFTERPTDQNRRNRDAAESQLIEDRRRIERANAAVDRARSEAQTDPRIVAIDRQLQDIRDQRESIAENARLTNTEADPRQMEGLAQQEADLIAQRDARIRELTRSEQQLVDGIAQEIAARNKMIEQLEKQAEFDEEVLRRPRPDGDALRGLDLSETPGQRLGRETAQGLADIDAAFRERGRQIVEEAGGLFDIDQQEQRRLDQNEADRQAAIARFLEDQARAAAPAIFGLADSVANALLQGPSRAALNATDVSTVEGQRELNRLLRGDDSARDQNIIELEKQSQSLKEATTYLKDIADKIGVTVDL